MFQLDRVTIKPCYAQAVAEQVYHMWVGASKNTEEEWLLEHEILRDYVSDNEPEYLTEIPG